jgi:hypothetical protein
MPDQVAQVQAPPAHGLDLAHAPALGLRVPVASAARGLAQGVLRQPAKHRVRNVLLRGVVAVALSIPRPRKAR